MAILVTSRRLSDYEKRRAFKDLEKVHMLRGRILHFSSIVDAILKEYVTGDIFRRHKLLFRSKKFKNLDFSDRIKIFINDLEGKPQYAGNAEFNEFKRKIEVLRKNYRNVWAHGFVFYEKFEIDPTDRKKKPINYITTNGGYVPIHFNSDHFNISNEIFPFILNWLYKNHFLTLLLRGYLRNGRIVLG